jgi:hypothetical protein
MFEQIIKPGIHCMDGFTNKKIVHLFIRILHGLYVVFTNVHCFISPICVSDVSEAFAVRVLYPAGWRCWSCTGGSCYCQLGDPETCCPVDGSTVGWSPAATEESVADGYTFRSSFGGVRSLVGLPPVSPVGRQVNRMYQR